MNKCNKNSFRAHEREASVPIYELQNVKINLFQMLHLFLRKLTTARDSLV